MKIISILCALILSLWASAGWAADPVTIPGTRVALVPPDRFVLSKDFAGLQGENASVLVVELPGATYEPLVAAISGGAMAKQGVEITGGEELADLPFRARMFRGRQIAQGREIDKWIMLVDGGSVLALINVSALKGSAALVDAQVRNMFRSVRLSAAPASDPVSTLPFTLAAAPRFAHRQALAGTGLIVTIAAPSAANLGQPGLVVSRVFEHAIPKAQWTQAVAAFVKSSQAIKFDKVDDPKPTKVGDLEGLEFMASGTSTGAPVKGLVVMLFAPTSGYVLIGMSSPEQFAGAVGDFREMIASFRLKP